MVAMDTARANVGIASVGIASVMEIFWLAFTRALSTEVKHYHTRAGGGPTGRDVLGIARANFAIATVMAMQQAIMAKDKK